LTYGKEQIELFNEVDANKDGELSYNEMMDAIGESKDADSFRVYTKTEKVNFLMNRYDTNKNGNLGFAEVKAFLIDIGYTYPSNNDIYWIISLIDTNRDSKISWNELFNGLK
jgi:Ca2+-binding EF-hand superfamily protein